MRKTFTFSATRDVIRHDGDQVLGNIELSLLDQPSLDEDAIPEHGRELSHADIADRDALLLLDRLFPRRMSHAGIPRQAFEVRGMGISTKGMPVRRRRRDIDISTLEVATIAAISGGIVPRSGRTVLRSSLVMVHHSARAIDHYTGRSMMCAVSDADFGRVFTGGGND